MKAEHINPFLTAVHTVLKEVLPDIQMSREPLRKINSPIATQGCAAFIGLTGEVEGRVILDMNKETAIKIAAAMNDEDMTEFDAMVASTINELSNMIIGSAITSLNNIGAAFDITAPTMFTGNSVELIDGDSLGEAVIIPINSSYGEVLLNIAIKD
jgi:chemotaxis protein CheX